MIIWSGLGFLVLVFGFASLWAMDGLTAQWFGQPEYYAEHGWPKLLALWVAAVPTWFVGSRLNSRHRRLWTDPQTGETRLRASRHTFFFVPMQYWAILLAGFGLIVQFMGRSA